MAQSQINISTPETVKQNEWWCVQADVGGHPLWFKSKNIEIAARPESFLTAFFIPALHTRSRLVFGGEVDTEWIQNTARLLPIYDRWWKYPLEHPLTGKKSVQHEEIEDNRVIQRGTKNQAAMCFTGGADSFYSLLCGPDQIKYLLFVNGFDIPLDDTERFNEFEQSLVNICDNTNTQAVVVHTNLRSHPLFSRVSWERTHGAALASIGMLLTKRINSLIIPSSYTYETSIPWGSHWQTDPMWSIPGRLAIIHRGADTKKRKKIAKIAAAPLVHRHLRVCWENLSRTGNCSRCEKCLRTMVTLESIGRLPDFNKVFDVETPLYRLLDSLEYIPHHLLVAWDKIGDENLTEENRKAINRLKERSRRVNRRKRFSRRYNFLKHKLKSGFKKAGRLLFPTSD